MNTKLLHLRTSLLLPFLIIISGFLNAQEDFTTVGSANILSTNTYQLTPAEGDKGGSIWSHEYIDINNDFLVSAEIYLGTNDDNGADGIAFVIQNLCAGTGSDGGGIGYFGINPSLAIEFDTWQNSEYEDPFDDHVSLQKNGDLSHNTSSNLAGPISLSNLEDGKYHPVKISWNATSQKIKVELDGVVQFDQYVGDIVNTIFSGNNLVLFGFTAATGGANNDQRVRVLSVSSTSVAQYNISRPTCVNNISGNIQLTPSGQNGPFTYNWSNGSTSQNQSGLSPGTYSVTILDANSCESVLEIDLFADYDLDGDGYSAIGSGCGTMDDCDDNDPTVYPGATELCDGLDNNCDGVIPATEIDIDDDGYSECQGDCDDSNAAINPDATEILGNNIDDNCDGIIDGFPYCEPSVTYACQYMYISNVTLGDIVNTTTCNGGYSDYTNLSTQVVPGNSYTISVEVANNTQYIRVYVDWNLDGDFDDNEETVVSEMLVSANSNKEESFSVPTNVIGSFRMRIASNYRSFPTPCTSVYGEFEDYTIVVASSDTDGDGINDDVDNCPNTANADQANNDGDAQGDVCDDDDDNDGILDVNDSCPFEANTPTAITCPADIIVNSDPNTCGVTNVSLEIPTISGGCVATGNALDFNEFENGITVPDFLPLLKQTYNATISAWIYPRVESPDFHHIDFLQDAIQMNTWQHVAFSFDSEFFKVYRNGVFLGSIKLNIPLLDFIDAIEDIEIDVDTEIDANVDPELVDTYEAIKQMVNGNLPFSTLGSKLDEVRVWNIIRTQEEIQMDMNSEISAQPGLIALYHFNEGVAGGNNAGVTTAFDSSGNDFDITLNDFALTGTTSNWVEGKSFNGVTISNDAPIVYNPIVFNVGPNAEATVTVNGPNTAVYPYGVTTITWTAKDASGNVETCTQNVIVTNPVSVWIGAIDSDWGNPGNWEAGNAPGFTVYNRLLIQTSKPNYPILTSGQNLYLSECVSMNIEAFASLTVNPNAVVTNDGWISINGSLTFRSDTSGSGYIGAGSGTFNGDATIERYIPAKRAFRFLSSSVATDDFIANNWQLDTHITGSTSGANGFDITNTGNPSMYTYNNVNQSWNDVPNTDATNLNSGEPYRLMVRGDRTIDLTDNAPAPTPTTLMATGVLTAENNTPTPLVLNETANGYSFIGNPFQAQVDMQATLNSNTNNVDNAKYWVWDPTLGIRGAYATVIMSAGFATGGDQNNYLQAGQACFVKTNAAGAAALTFNQANKKTSAPETNVFRSSGKTSNTISTSYLGLKLYESSAYASNGTEADGLLIFFDDENNNEVDDADADDFANEDENFSINNNGKILSVEYRAIPMSEDEIVLEINTYRNSNYTIVASASALKGDTAFLLDTYLNQTTEIPQNGTATYDYSIDSGISASYAGDRFKIIFQNTLSTENNELSQILLYPNPSKNGNFYLNIPQSMNNLELTIYNALGAKVFHTKELSTGNKIPVGAKFSKSDGVYFVKLTSRGLTTTKKLIIN